MDSDFFSSSDLELKFDKKALIVVIVLIAVGVFLLTSILSLASSGTSAMYRATAYKAPLQDFSLVAYPVFLLAGFFVVMYAKNLARISNSDLSLAIELAGALLVFVSSIMLLWLSSFFQTMGTAGFSSDFFWQWISRLLIFAVIGIILLVLGKKLNQNQTLYAGVLSFVLVPTWFLSGIAILGFGIRDFAIYRAPTYATTQLNAQERFGWVATVALLLVLCMLGVWFLRKKIDKKALNPFSFSLKIAGWIFAGVALLIFILAIFRFDIVHFKVEDFFPLILEPIAYGIIGVFCLGSHGKLKKALQ